MVDLINWVGKQHEEENRVVLTLCILPWKILFSSFGQTRY